MPVVRALTVHAGYRCRHAGACCSSDWPIPVESDRLLAIRAAMAEGRLRTSNDGPPTQPVANEADDTVLLARRHGACVFHDTSGSHGVCRIHASLGHGALPLACRQFPRFSVHDPRGVSVTLSHYCPTAAAMLDADSSPVAITTEAPAFPPEAEYVGLDARQALPPLLRPGMLMDWDSWWTCERQGVALFSDGPDADTALARLRVALGRIDDWSPSDGPLTKRVADAFDDARTRSVAPLTASAQLVTAAFEAIPADVRPDRLAPGPHPSEAARSRFLAAHAFANWTAHLGSGLRVWCRSIETAAALLDAGAGVREADLVLRHLADPATLADRLR